MAVPFLIANVYPQGRECVVAGSEVPVIVEGNAWCASGWCVRLCRSVYGFVHTQAVVPFVLLQLPSAHDGVHKSWYPC